MNILIVDDEILEIEQLTYLINEKYPEWKIFRAEDTVQAKQILLVQTIHLALLDIHLPGESGLELFKYIRQHYQTECVIVTAFAEFQYAQQAIKLQALDYLVKPIMTDELYQMLNKYIQKVGYVEGQSQLIRQALEFIHEHYPEKIHLSMLANEVHTSPNYLSRKFSKEIGMSFQEYLTLHRIEIAKKLLKKQPDWSIQKISEEVGFASIHYFSLSFKKHVGSTPSQYRESPHHD
ncbi:helix-turn-helix domain-containing protein [Caldibacillus sp. 210928-DFI.2.22]|uniref:response regulator transcription factor n=1 Tax=unclassified Caldibacillus TaxID=2641266 RepID=UPI001D0650B5|nr:MULTISPECIES: helix-turn-helix domain-containing protein [unclassified Caldibacillus]MCB7071543.1 helix-turn-helix domain-containing protein [Caldibacillus sp. 210928-DFI.2.22]MCB7074976.1 helix-turn-helix domain-containing protein [Caldibacillus sp. 210928-DFI.2.18]